MSDREVINPEVLKIAKINLEGNIIPQQWYRHITYPSGKPNPIAVTLLAEIVYWYRPVIERDPITGEVIGYRKKFKGDKLQRSYQSFADQFGFSKRQVQDAMKRLVELGLIRIEFRNIKTETGLVLTNVMYVEPVTEEIERITYDGINKIYEKEADEETEESERHKKITAHDIDTNSCSTSHDKMKEVPRSKVIPVTFERRTSHDKTEEVSRSNVIPPSAHRGTYTENTTQTTTENTTEKQKKHLQGTTAGITLSRERKSSRESIYLLSKKVNTKLAKLIKASKLMYYYCLVNKITIKPSKYKILRYRDDNVYSRIKNNKNLSLETYTNSKDLHSVPGQYPNTERNIATCSSNKNISPGRDSISHVRDYTNRKDTKLVSDSYEEGSIYALTRINTGVNNLNLGTGEKILESDHDSQNTELSCSEDISFSKNKDAALCKVTPVFAEKGITTAQQAKEESDSWEKVSSDEEIRYSYGDWDDYSIEEFDDGIIHTSPKAPQEIFNAGTAFVICSNEAEVSSSTETAAFEEGRDSAVKSEAFHSSERVIIKLLAANCPGVTGRQVSEAVKSEAAKHNSRVQPSLCLLNRQQRNSQQAFNTGISKKASAENSAGACFEMIKQQIPEIEFRKGETVKPDSRVLYIVYLMNLQQSTLTPEASAEHAFYGADSSSEHAVSCSTENTADCREKTVFCLGKKFKADSGRLNTEPAAGICFEVINRQTPELVRTRTAVRGCQLLNRYQSILIPSAASNKHAFFRDGPF
ncbi:hypothetical protein O163_10175 [Caldanaerobacter subterraneus subsp. yonseiensis KB-1]|uniref:DNA replication protein DnaD n=1 Tax=Caldanaerobacter subterraneus subsp. yonseiensis KB-1 TaxID=1388761 RepID=U5CNF3_CALSX|nr:hypothetical protein [Caldanaerobacter subterraneus]ERM91528.1 hypothetical protein O163_10175 [Caldanaerobacter subterraneus subsp. yonseiensis KB-1]